MTEQFTSYISLYFKGLSMRYAGAKKSQLASKPLVNLLHQWPLSLVVVRLVLPVNNFTFSFFRTILNTRFIVTKFGFKHF